MYPLAQKSIEGHLAAVGFDLAGGLQVHHFNVENA